MPIFGGFTPTAAGLPTIRALAEDRIDIEAAETLTFTFEVLSEPAIAALPAATLHPPFPTYCSLVVRRHDDSPYGPFTTAELRLHARATNHYVGYCSWLPLSIDNEAACAWLRNAYGLPCAARRDSAPEQAPLWLRGPGSLAKWGSGGARRGAGDPGVHLGAMTSCMSRTATQFPRWTAFRP